MNKVEYFVELGIHRTDRLRFRFKEMTNRERIKKDISTAFDFAEKIINEPEVLDKISTGSTIDFLESGLEKHEQKAENKKRKYVRIKHQFEVL